MLVNAIYVRNFRGIKHLDWLPGPGLNCLIGHGDGGKTTVLDALELLLAERHNATFDDLDFYGGSATEPISITAVFTGFPQELKRDDKYGLSLSGWGPNGWVEEPSEPNGIAPALVLQLVVDSTFEPRWSIYTQRAGVGDNSKSINFQDRKLFSTARLGIYADRHLAWGRGSSLQRVSAHPEQLPATLNELVRSTRASFAEAAKSAFSDTLALVKPDIEKLGVRLRDGLAANLDRASLSLNASGVALHDGDVPLRCAGTGTARLAVAALQSTEQADRRFLLVDELEFGLEPHRISLLVSHLRQRTKANGQAFVTTHSPIVLREARFGEVQVCRRCDDGTMTIIPGSSAATKAADAKRYVRDRGEALLSRSVLVCEGQTEVALVKGFASGNRPDYQSQGVVFQDGGGSDASQLALHLAALGYRTALLTDSDRPLPDTVEKNLANAGIAHFCWDDGKCTEEELFTGIPKEQRLQLLKIIEPELDLRRILGEFRSVTKLEADSLESLNDFLDDPNVGRALGRQAHAGRWIKNDYDLCFHLGNEVLGMVWLLGQPCSCLTHLERIAGWMEGDA